MDEAAKEIQSVAQHYLPDSPHRLALSHHSRFPEPEGWWFKGPSSGLQYATFISATTRGILTTRAHYDICEDLNQPQPTMATLSAAKSGEPKKKMSLLDYHNRKKSSSPVENGTSTAKSSEHKTNGALPAKPPPPKDEGKKEVSRVAAEKPAAPKQPNTPLDRPRPESNGEGYEDQFVRVGDDR